MQATLLYEHRSCARASLLARQSGLPLLECHGRHYSNFMSVTPARVCPICRTSALVSAGHGHPRPFCLMWMCTSANLGACKHLPPRKTASMDHGRLRKHLHDVVDSHAGIYKNLGACWALVECPTCAYSGKFGRLCRRDQRACTGACRNGCPQTSVCRQRTSVNGR